MAIKAGNVFRRALWRGTSVIAICSALSVMDGHSAHAQGAPTTPQATQAPQVEEIVVTGSRIIRDGYEAPTPLTVIGVEQINSAAPSNIADMVNQLPSLAGSTTPHAGGADVSTGRQGLNNLNLRGLGINRTLVLLDGQRVVGSSLDGAVDVNGFPQELIARVDIVTGGASAAYGSDAVSGVVNFVLDKEFVGVKGSVQGGVTTYGDDRSWNASLTAGQAFAGGRGHYLISGELGKVDGIVGVPRAWNQRGWGLMMNPAYTATNGLPRLIVVADQGASNASPGGIITAGPLKGIEFGPGGVPRQFNYGSVLFDPQMQGGDWRSTDYQNDGSLDNVVSRQSVFTRASYDITDNFRVFALVSWAHSSALGYCCRQFNFANITIRTDNAFLPPSVAAQAAALKLTTLQIGTMNRDLPIITTLNDRRLSRYVLGAEGKLDALSSSWNWEVYAQKGISFTSLEAPRISIKTNFAQAMDAVRGANGQIVCRSTLTNPANGCVPYNILGIGVNSAAAVNYVLGDSHLNATLRQNVYAASIRGEPFAIWAGPVSFATGIEYREESVTGKADPLSEINEYFAGNYKATFGRYNVTEGFVETVIPLAKGTSWAKALDLNGALRATSYSTSGFVATWKLGLTYSPIDDIRLRATRSRDIRAPNLLEAFVSGQANTSTVTDPFRDNLTTNYQGLQLGNPALKPESADTTGLGVVYQPGWFTGFSASFDYYNIDISGAIASIGAQEIVNRCFTGNAVLCNQISRNAAGVITQITNFPFNLVQQTARGFDMEGSYRTPLDAMFPSLSGNLTIRGLATRFLSNQTNDGLRVTEAAGSNSGGGPPKWRWHLQATFDQDRYSFTLTGRGLSSGVYNTAYVECRSGCPASTTNNMTIDNNHIDGAIYLDAALNYKFPAGATDMEFFLTVQNLMDRDPAVVAPGPGRTGVQSQSTNPSLYDNLGRTFRAGIRFKI